MEALLKAIFIFCLALYTINVRAQVTDFGAGQNDHQSTLVFLDDVIFDDDARMNEASHGRMVEEVSDSFFAPSHLFNPSPRRAVIYSAIFPGLGQAYNRQFWKIPIVFTGLAGFTYAITWNQGYFRDYQAAFVDIRSGDPTARRWVYFVPAGVDPDQFLQDRGRDWFAGVLENRRDQYRHWRDLSIILTVGFYLLAMVDAYVDARLFNFTMSQDLSMRIAPTMITQKNNSPNNTILNSAHGLQWSFRF